MTDRLASQSETSVRKEENMTQNRHAKHLLPKKEKRMVSLELIDLLDVAGEGSALQVETSFDEMLVGMIVNALVNHGKEREHIEKVSQISTLLARAMRLDSNFCTVIEKASLVYDIGNLRISPALYKKEKTLSFEESEIVKKHTLIGQDIQSTQHSPVMEMAARVAAEHHEWYDGSGYPYGKKSDALALESRIVAVADAAAALHSPRYGGRKIMDFDVIMAHISKRSALQFDPKVVEVFLAYGTEIRIILERRQYQKAS